MPGESGLLSLLWVLLCVLVIVGAAYWFTKHVVGQRLGGRIGLGRTDGLRVLTRAQLGRDQSLLVVQAGERYFLLGAAPSGPHWIARAPRPPERAASRAAASTGRSPGRTRSTIIRPDPPQIMPDWAASDRKSTRLNSSHS